jgi:hypothetical protein
MADRSPADTATIHREEVIGVITVAEDLIKLIGDLIPLVLPLLGL